MIKETIKESPDYQKVNKTYIINRNDSDYQAAIKRIKNQNKQRNFENRLNLLESKLNTIIELLNKS
jgi:hypothetical protein